MSENKLLDGIQLATGLAVVVGLILVFIELRQTKSLSLAELTSEGYSEVMADFRTLMGENSAAVIAKSCFTPEQLQPDELVVLHAYYKSKVSQIARLRILEIVADYGVPWESVAEQQLAEVLNSTPGQAWFKRIESLDPELYALGVKAQSRVLDCEKSLQVGLPDIDA